MALVHYVAPENNQNSKMVAACNKRYRQGAYIGGQFFQNTDDKTKVSCPKCAKALGIEPAADLSKVSKNPEAICACCFRAQKVKPDGNMFKHGYQRPGYGYIIGGCPGENFPPYAAK